ncbi:MAG: TfoX/Sxy family DNA transformation protein [Patescibacteria group bacterium]
MLYRRRLPPPETPVDRLWNISDSLADQLNNLKIFTYEDLTSKNLIDLWSDLKAKYRGISKLTYYALWGAVTNIHWKNVPPSEIEKIESFISTKKVTTPELLEIRK